MSANSVNTIANILIVLAFGAAIAGVIAMPVRTGGVMRNGIKLLLGGAMGIYAFVGVSHVLQFTGVTAAFDIFENYLKVLFIPLLAAAVYAMCMNEQLRLTERQSRVLSAQHEMLMRIVDTTPNGLLVVSADGRIEFANDRARSLLELEEDPDTSRFRTPAWRCCDNEHPGDLLQCLSGESLRDKPCVFTWPDGTALRLMLYATPIEGADGTAVGAVVAVTAAESAAAMA